MQLYSLQIEKFYHAGSGKGKVIPYSKLFKKMNQVICLPPGNECEEKIVVDTKKCLKSCKGVYADVTKMESKNITGHQLDSLMLDYNKYKRFGDLSKSNEKLKKDT